MNIQSLLVFLLAVSSLTGCAIAPTHPSLVNAPLTGLVPARAFVADSDANYQYQISPDGKSLAWVGVDGAHAALMVRRLAEEKVKVFPKAGRSFRWAADSRHLLLDLDKGGDEDNHIYAATVEGDDTALVDLTPYGKTRSAIVRTVENSSDVMVITNKRDKKVFDLIRIDVDTRQAKVIATNPGSVVSWVVDRRGNLVARVLQDGEQRSLQTRDATRADTWKSTAQWSAFDFFLIAEITEDGQGAWALSNRGRDKISLVKVALATGIETVEYAEPDVDIDAVRFSNRLRQPLMVMSEPGYPKNKVFDVRLGERLAALGESKPAGVYINSIDNQDRRMTLSVLTSRGATRYLYDRESDQLTHLGEDKFARMAASLASTEPVLFNARDGLSLHGYLTLPGGVEAVNLPMVLLVHGGPWARDKWSEGTIRQFFANRGYAVLQVNYRGSTGYGRAFMDKAIGEFAGRMHDDLVDGVNWLVQRGVADRKRVGIWGASYGGYSTLVGLTFTPEVFACGVDVVGMSDLTSLLENKPAYWELGSHWWHKFVGNPAVEADRAVMASKSPLYKVDAVTRPLLIMHGVNDPRVKVAQSDRMVAALRDAGKEVDYVRFTGEGHGGMGWANNLKMYRKTEDFFARCLGGRSNGFDLYELASWAF